MLHDNVTVWGIHAGENGEAEKLFLNCKSPLIALGWPQMGNLEDLQQNRDAYKEKVKHAVPDIKKGAIPTTAGMLFRFVNEMKQGDIVIFPSKNSRLVHLGEVIGPYFYSVEPDQEYCHTRSVKWMKKFARSDFSQGALYEIGSALSFFQVKNYYDEFIAMLDGKPTEVKVGQDVTVNDVFESTEQNTKDFIYKKLSKELKGYPFEDFIAQLLNVIGYNTRISPQGGDGGIDIIAFKDELGIEPPIIKVQVKSYDGDVAPDKVQALYGTVAGGEYGLFITLGNFSKKAIEFAKSKSNLRIINGDELIELILKHYDKLDSKYKALIPLKNIYIPTQVDQ